MIPPLLQSFGGAGSRPAFALGFADLGAGVVDTSTQAVAATPTFTRATTAWTKLSSGLWASVASGSPRSFYSGFNTAAGTYLGFLSETARTNLCLQARDLSNASWTKVNTTGAKDQIGIDGVSNSASSLTCTTNGGTCLQVITEAATDSTLSMFIKRISGNGTITIQQGASTSDITAQLNSLTYTQVSLDATVLNPAIGIVMGTSGDVIAVDMCQFENAAFPSTPIPTTTIAVARNADVLTYPTTGWFNSATGTLFATFKKNSETVDTTGGILFEINDSSLNNRIYLFAASVAGTPKTQLDVWDGGVEQAPINTNYTAANANNKSAGTYTANDFAACVNGGTVGTDTSGTTGTGINIARLGSGGSGGLQLNGAILGARYFSSRLANAQLQAMTA